MAEALTVLGLPAFSNRDRNPYNALLYGALRARGLGVREWSSRDALRAKPAAAIVHVHWPEGHLNHRRWFRAATRSLRLLAQLAAARRRGSAIVWTAHNAGSHEQRFRRTEAAFWRAFLRLVDGWIALSDDAARAARVRWPRLDQVPDAVVPHGHYRDAYDAPPPRGASRDTVGLAADHRVAGFVGRIKAYKGVPALMRAFTELPDDDVRLLVAGRVETPALAAELRELAGRDARIVLREGVVADHELTTLLAACDVVVAPFEAILNSGSVLLALSFARPVLVPALGSMPALAREVGDEWVHLYDPPLRPAAIEDALDRARRAAGAPDLSRYEWPAIASATHALYERAVDHRASRRKLRG